CPHLLIATIRAMEAMCEGQRLQIIATDLNAPSSISAWAKQSGNQLVDLYDEDGTFTFILQRQEIKSSSSPSISTTESERKVL
ncbi:MAG: sulfurtransferase TusA family protein, partial [Methylococcales bacterium]|nr:sulfurtransferase TusA family protein [Methylococcales bacterium]